MVHTVVTRWQACRLRGGVCGAALARSAACAAQPRVEGPEPSEDSAGCLRPLTWVFVSLPVDSTPAPGAAPRAPGGLALRVVAPEAPGRLVGGVRIEIGESRLAFADTASEEANRRRTAALERGEPAVEALPGCARLVATVLSPGTGWAAGRGLRPGRYEVHFGRQLWRPARYRVSVRPGRTDTLTLSLCAGASACDL